MQSKKTLIVMLADEAWKDLNVGLRRKADVMVGDCWRRVEVAELRRKFIAGRANEQRKRRGSRCDGGARLISLFAIQGSVSSRHDYSLPWAASPAGRAFTARR